MEKVWSEKRKEQSVSKVRTIIRHTCLFWSCGVLVFDLDQLIFIFISLYVPARSYYRCTTRNCPVKKRVERMFENPSTVMTTYEGQHIHQYPVTPALKGNSQVFSPPPPPPSSSLGFFKQQPSVMQRQIYSQINGGLLQTNKTSTSTSLQQQKQPLPSLDFSIDFGFLEDDLGSRN